MSDWSWQVVEWRQEELRGQEIGGGPNPQPAPGFVKVPWVFDYSCCCGHSGRTRAKRIRGGFELKCSECKAIEYLLASEVN